MRKIHLRKRLAVAGAIAGIPVVAVLLTGRPVTASVRSSETPFLLGGNAQNALDPENSANEVIKMDTLAPPFYGTVSRRLGTKITALDNMLEAKAYFFNRSCGGGSPRIQLK